LVVLAAPPSGAWACTCLYKETTADCVVLHSGGCQRLVIDRETYRAVLDRACTRLAGTVGTGDYGEDAAFG